MTSDPQPAIRNPQPRLTVIGVGLIGGSLASALRRAGAVAEVVGAGRDAAHLQRALELGVVDRFETDLGRAVSGADLVLVAVPLGAMEGVFAAIAPHLEREAIVTDVGSAKVGVAAAARRSLGAAVARFVPGHPIAGRERSGVEASDPELYHGRRVILTPLPENPPEAVAAVRRLWREAGAEVSEMAPEHHDEVLAATSHLPHLLAFALVDSLAGMKYGEEIFQYAAGGFRDFTRIASSDPVMWRDICLHNREALLAVTDHYLADLGRLRAAVAAGDGEAIIDTFRRAKRARDTHVIK